MKMDRSKAVILLTVMALAAMLGSMVSIAYAADNGEESSNDLLGWGRGWLGAMENSNGLFGYGRGPLGGRGRFGFVKVSEEFEQNAISIAESDQDVQDLLDDGYSIAGVRPMIKSTVEANGDVVTKATSAIVMLEKDTTSRACVRVDLEEAKVTEIVILTRTVIEKT